MNTLTILVMGKGGVGKSSTVNSIIGERAVSVNPFQVSAAFSLRVICMVSVLLTTYLCIFVCVLSYSLKHQHPLWCRGQGLVLR